MSQQPLLPYDILHTIIAHTSHREDLKNWTLVGNADVRRSAQARLCERVKVGEKVADEFLRRLFEDSSLLAHNLTHLTLHLPSLPYTLLNLPSDPRFPLESLTLFLPSTPNPPLITDAHAPLLRLFDPKQLTIRPPDEGARGIFNFVVQRKAREALSSYSSLNKLKYQTCNLLTFTTFPRPGSSCLSLFHRSDASSREEVEMVYDLRTLCFGRTFFEFFLGMREDEELGSAGEGEAVGGGGMDQVTVLVSDADKKEWVDQGLARKPFKGGTMRVRVLVQPSSSEEQEG